MQRHVGPTQQCACIGAYEACSCGLGVFLCGWMYWRAPLRSMTFPSVLSSNASAFAYITASITKSFAN